MKTLFFIFFGIILFSAVKAQDTTSQGLTPRQRYKLEKLKLKLQEKSALPVGSKKSHQVKRTSTNEPVDSNFTGTVTNGINTNWGSATDRIVVLKQPNGDVATLIPVYKGNKVQGWDVVMTDKNGAVVYNKTHERKKYQKALKDAYADCYGYRHRGAFWSALLYSAAYGGYPYRYYYGNYYNSGYPQGNVSYPTPTYSSDSGVQGYRR